MISGRRIEPTLLELEAADVFSWRLGHRLESAERPLDSGLSGLENVRHCLSDRMPINTNYSFSVIGDFPPGMRRGFLIIPLPGRERAG